MGFEIRGLSFEEAKAILIALEAREIHYSLKHIESENKEDAENCIAQRKRYSELKNFIKAQIDKQLHE